MSCDGDSVSITAAMQPSLEDFITSRICGICGDNHATCSVYAQNMAYGIDMPPMAEWSTWTRKASWVSARLSKRLLTKPCE